MRDILEKLDNILLEKSRGLLYRDKGDQFFQGDKDNPTAEIVFDKAEYFPSQGGAYADYDEMATVGQDLARQYPSITWVNKPTASSKAFAVLTFDGPTKGQKTHFGRFFSEIKPDMAGLWKNNELPGGWQLNKAVSLKGSYYKLKPVDLFPINSTFDSPSATVAELKVNPKNNPAVPKIVPGMEQLLGGKFPVFTDVGDMATAIRDDLGETIGPIALIQGMITSGGAEAARKDILGPRGTYAGAKINFPAAKNNGLVDSYLLTTDTNGNAVEIGISSKGEKGANASVKNIADGIKVAREKDMTDLLRKYAEQVDVIEEVGGLPSLQFPIKYGAELGFITPQQGEYILDLVKNNSFNAVKMPAKDREVLQNLMTQIKAKTDNVRYNIGYHILAVLARMVSQEINSDPRFGEACLKFLNISPIIQLHLNGVEGANNYTVTGFKSKYPPDFKGTVGLDATKVYASTGIIGRVSFSYNGAGDKDTDVEVSTPGEIDQGAERITQTRSDIKAAPEPASSAGEPDEKVLGRKKRR